MPVNLSFNQGQRKRKQERKTPCGSLTTLPFRERRPLCTCRSAGRRSDFCAHSEGGKTKVCCQEGPCPRPLTERTGTLARWTSKPDVAPIRAAVEPAPPPFLTTPCLAVATETGNASMHCAGGGVESLLLGPPGGSLVGEVRFQSPTQQPERGNPSPCLRPWGVTAG